MADIKLGPEGYEVTLPPISWLGGEGPLVPVDYGRQADGQTMLDGSVRYNFRPRAMKSWELEWGRLTAAQFAEIAELYVLGRPLRLQCGYISADWYWVVFDAFKVNARVTSFLSSTPLYSLSMTLKESA